MKSLKYIAFATIGLLAFSSQGCRKKKDTIVEVTVKNVNNEVVSGASVNLYPVGTPPVVSGYAWNKTATTASNGIATFDFNDIYQLGQAGVAISNITATKDGAVANGVVKIEAETVTPVTVYM